MVGTMIGKYAIMRINDLLFETAHDEHNIQAIARAIVTWLDENTDELTGDNQTLGTITMLTGVEDPLLGDIKIAIEHQRPNARGAWRPSSNSISVVFEHFFEQYGEEVYVKEETKLYSVLVHELRHALDHNLSNGKYRHNKGNDGEYLQRPKEINARFSQSLIDIKQAVADGTDPVSAIKTSFKRYRIDRVFPNGVQDLKYRRLFNRALEYAQSI
jgi:hypothetical protein